MNSINLVALPTQIGNTPSAMGSRVPVCPTLREFASLRTKFTASWDVISLGLRNTITPSVPDESARDL
jgi:hypothetical protein